MALNQHYTWKNFLTEHPEFKTKKIKRTSEEGKKAFEAAYKKYIKEYLKTRLGSQEKGVKALTAKRDTLVKTLSAAKKSPAKARALRVKVGTQEHALFRAQKTVERTKSLQKQF